MAYPRNNASPIRFAVGQVVQISDGAVQTTGVGVTVTKDGGAEVAAGGTVAFSATGTLHYTPTQAETNDIGYIVEASKTGCLSAFTTVVTSASDVAGHAGIDLSKVNAPTSTLALTNTTIGNVTNLATYTGNTKQTTDHTAGIAAISTVVPPTVAQLNARTLLAADYFDPAVDSIIAPVTLPTIPLNWITAAGIAANALNGKGNWNIGKSGYALAQAFPANFADLSITLTTGFVDANLAAPDNAGIAANGTAIATAQADLDIITGVSGVNLLTATQASIDAIETDTGTTIPSTLTDMSGASFLTATDSLEAIRNRGDSSWTTGAGGTPPQLLQNTTIATLATQTSFTLTAGSADDTAYAGAVVVVTDSVTSTQKAVGSVSAYTGATKTITLSSDPAVFVMAAGDTIDIIANASTAPSAAAVRAEIDTNSTQLALIVADTNELQSDWANAGRLDAILDSRMAEASINTTLGTVDTVNLVATTTTNTDMRGTDGANTTAPDNAGIAANASSIAALNNIAATDIVSAGAITTLIGAVVTVTNNTDMRGTDSANTVTPDNAGIGANGAAIAALNNVAATDIVSSGAITTLTGAIVSVTTVATTTTNSDMRGTDNAALAIGAATAAAQATAQSDLDIITGTDGAKLATAQTATVNADVKKVNGVTINGDGVGTPMGV